MMYSQSLQKQPGGGPNEPHNNRDSGENRDSVSEQEVVYFASWVPSQALRHALCPVTQVGRSASKVSAKVTYF